jgi:hypothetical protein
VKGLRRKQGRNLSACGAFLSYFRAFFPEPFAAVNHVGPACHHDLVVLAPDDLDEAAHGMHVDLAVRQVVDCAGDGRRA